MADGVFEVNGHGGGTCADRSRASATGRRRKPQADANQIGAVMRMVIRLHARWGAEVEPERVDDARGDEEETVVRAGKAAR